MSFQLVHQINKVMKINKTSTKIAVLSFAVLLFVSTSESFAQTETRAKYWTIENNINDKSFTIVRFYNNYDELVSERKIEGKFLKLNKRDIRRLNKELLAYNVDQTQQNYIASKE